MGKLANVRGELVKAEEYFRQGLAISERLAPSRLDVAANLNGLGNVADSRGDLDKAEEYYRQALTIKEKLAPGSLDVAASLNNLGNVESGRGNLKLPISANTGKCEVLRPTPIAVGNYNNIENTWRVVSSCYCFLCFRHGSEGV